MTRLSLAFLVLVLANYGARAAEKSYRLGDLEPTAASAEITRNTIVPELAKLGFQEGTNLVIDERVGDATAMPGLAQDLILSRPDAIIAFGTDAILAAHKASATIPIVTFGPDPVTLGLAASIRAIREGVVELVGSTLKGHSITSSARARIDGGTVRSSASAVFRLITRSKAVGCWTGRSAGLAP